MNFEPRTFIKQKIFEDFFIIGVEDQELAQSQGIVSFIDPQMLYSHFQAQVEQAVKERRKVLKDFCFPDKVPVRKLNGIKEARALMNYKPQPVSFIFTLNANEDEAEED